MDVSARITNIGRSASILGAWVIIASIAALVMNIGDAIEGEGEGEGEGYAITRVILALVGLIAAGVF